jgi:hypothetical protein
MSFLIFLPSAYVQPPDLLRGFLIQETHADKSFEEMRQSVTKLNCQSPAKKGDNLHGYIGLNASFGMQWPILLVDVWQKVEAGAKVSFSILFLILLGEWFQWGILVPLRMDRDGGRE